MSGFGGAGAFSDGKYNITNDFGGTLFEYIGKKEALELMRYVDSINMKYGGEGTKLYSTAGSSFKRICIVLKKSQINLGRKRSCLRSILGTKYFFSQNSLISKFFKIHQMI